MYRLMRTNTHDLVANWGYRDGFNGTRPMSGLTLDFRFTYDNAYSLGRADRVIYDRISEKLQTSGYAVVRGKNRLWVTDETPEQVKKAHPAHGMYSTRQFYEGVGGITTMKFLYKYRTDTLLVVRYNLIYTYNIHTI